MGLDENLQDLNARASRNIYMKSVADNDTTIKSLVRYSGFPRDPSAA